MEVILPGAPWLIAHRSMLGINQPYKITLNGQDYVLWQNQQGKVFALDNICPHMQAPLSDGWICQNGNTIACPFHAIEFDGQGRMHDTGKVSSQPLATPLELIIQDDCIWTYGGHAPKIPVSDLMSKVTVGMSFLGVTGDKSIRGTFLDSLSINYDYNHQNGTHRELFGIQANRIPLFEHDGYYAQVVQELDHSSPTWNDILQNPIVLIAPKTYTGILEYAFPALTTFRADFPIGEVLQVHVLYPETTTQTKTFVLVYSKPKHPILKPLLGKFVLSAVGTVVEQDTRAIETSYPRHPAKIRLPNEEIMFYAQKLYHDW